MQATLTIFEFLLQRESYVALVGDFHPHTGVIRHVIFASKVECGGVRTGRPAESNSSLQIFTYFVVDCTAEILSIITTI